MQTVVKTFRFPKKIARFLEQLARKKSVSQTEVMLGWVQQMMEQELQWKQDLAIMKNDSDFRNEQVNLAEEYYD